FWRKCAPSLFSSSRRKPYRRPRPAAEHLQHWSPLKLEALETRLAPATLTNTSTNLVLTLATNDFFFISGTPTAVEFTCASGNLTVNGNFYGFSSISGGNSTTASVIA